MGFYLTPMLYLNLLSFKLENLGSHCCCLVAKLCLTLCDAMICSTPGFPVLHCPLKFAQTHVHWVSDTIQPSHPVAPFSSCLQSFPASESFPMSWLFESGGQIIGASASVLPMNIQSWFPLGLTGLISLLSKGLARVFSSTTVRKHQFFNAQPSLWTNSHICTCLFVAQSVKNLPAVQETRVLSLGWEDPLEKEMATHSILAWKISWTEEPGGL